MSDAAHEARTSNCFPPPLVILKRACGFKTRVGRLVKRCSGRFRDPLIERKKKRGRNKTPYTLVLIWEQHFVNAATLLHRVALVKIVYYSLYRLSLLLAVTVGVVVVVVPFFSSPPPPPLPPKKKYIWIWHSAYQEPWDTHTFPQTRPARLHQKSFFSKLSVYFATSFSYWLSAIRLLAIWRKRQKLFLPRGMLGIFTI